MSTGALRLLRPSLVPQWRPVSTAVRSQAHQHQHHIFQQRTYASNSTPTPQPVKDDIHPHLYFHHLSDGQRIALSYLEQPPKSADSVAVIGCLPNDTNAGVESFKENPKFKTLLNASIKAAIESGAAQTVAVEALARGSDGYLHIADERKVPPAGRIPEPEDILGSVYVEDGEPRANTYEPQPMHRLLTSDGVTVLPYGIDDYVMQNLKKQVKTE